MEAARTHQVWCSPAAQVNDAITSLDPKCARALRQRTDARGRRCGPGLTADAGRSRA
jgi:hypothetical protein